jgi:hypothetical protein
MSSLLDRIGAFFLDPPIERDLAPPPPADTARPADEPTPTATAPTPRSSPLGFAPPVPPTHATSAQVADGAPAPAATASSTPLEDQFAVVLGAPTAAVPVAAACAGELRAQARAAAAVLCVWRGGEPPAGATTPAVRRLAARLAAHGLAATASGRLAWVALDPAPGDAAAQVQRARALAGAPVVLAVAGPRPAAFEPLLADAALALVVLPAEADETLRALALATLPSRASLAVPPLPPGPPRWAAMAGLARMRSLKPVAR